MHKMKTLFTTTAAVEPQGDTAARQEPRVTLNEVLLLNKMQAATRYNLGAPSIQKVAEDCGAIVRIGRRVVYNRKIMDEYFENIAE